MRNYQRTKNNPYLLPTNLYRRMVYLVRDYDRLKTEYESILHESPTNDGQPKGNRISDPTGDKAARRDKLWEQIEAIGEGLLSIPSEYRDGVLNHVKYRGRWPDCAHENTWKKWKARFLFYIAKKLREI